jgi:hypothetical protein
LFIGQGTGERRANEAGGHEGHEAGGVEGKILEATRVFTFWRRSSQEKRKKLKNRLAESGKSQIVVIRHREGFLRGMRA